MILCVSKWAIFPPVWIFFTQVRSIEINISLILKVHVTLDSVFGPDHSICVELIIHVMAVLWGVCTVLSSGHSVITCMYS